MLGLDLDAAESEALLQQHEALTAQVVQAEGEGRTDDAEALNQQAAALAPAMGFVVLRNPSARLLSGAFELNAADIIGASQFLHGTQEVVAELFFEQPGTYALVASTFEAGVEANFAIQFYSSSRSFAITPLNGGQVQLPGAPIKSGGARAQGPPPPPSAGKNALAQPTAKHDVGKLRGESDGDDGKMGHAQRLELEEAARLEKWIENLPMMTIEGQPLSENVKKRKDALVAQAMAFCERTGAKFEDSEFPRAAGSATGTRQPEIYASGEPGPNMPVVTQWLRPEEFVPLLSHVRPHCRRLNRWAQPPPPPRALIPSTPLVAAASRLLQERLRDGRHHPGRRDGQQVVHLRAQYRLRQPRPA